MLVERRPKKGLIMASERCVWRARRTRADKTLLHWDARWRFDQLLQAGKASVRDRELYRRPGCCKVHRLMSNPCGLDGITNSLRQVLAGAFDNNMSGALACHHLQRTRARVALLATGSHTVSLFLLSGYHHRHWKIISHRHVTINIYDNLYFTKQTLIDKKIKQKQQYRVRLRELSCWATNYRDNNIEQRKNLKNFKSLIHFISSC